MKGHLTNTRKSCYGGDTEEPEAEHPKEDSNEQRNRLQSIDSCGMVREVTVVGRKREAHSYQGKSSERWRTYGNEHSRSKVRSGKSSNIINTLSDMRTRGTILDSPIFHKPMEIHRIHEKRNHPA